MIFADWSTAVEVCTRLARRMQVRYRITRTEDGRWDAQEALSLGQRIRLNAAQKPVKAPRSDEGAKSGPPEVREPHVSWRRWLL